MTKAKIIDLFGEGHKKKRKSWSEEAIANNAENVRRRHAKNRQPILDLIISHGLLKCSKCKEVREISNFTKDKRRFSGYRGQCKLCNSEYYRKKNNEYYKLNRERVRGQKIWHFKKYVHGITKEQYYEYLANQGGVCAICKNVPEKELLVIDHNHETKKFRGLLCRKCNAALGMLKDSITIVRNAAEYLEKRGYYGKT